MKLMVYISLNEVSYKIFMQKNGGWDDTIPIFFCFFAHLFVVSLVASPRCVSSNEIRLVFPNWSYFTAPFFEVVAYWRGFVNTEPAAY